MNLEQMKAELREKAKKLEELRSKASITEEEKTERRSLLEACKKLAQDIKEMEEESRFFEGLDVSTVTPPKGVTPGAGTHITVEDKPIYRSFGEQLRDIITIENPRSPHASEARKRLMEAEKRMEIRKELDIELRNSIRKEQRAAGDGQVVGDAIYGGAFVQTDFATDIIHRGYNESIILSKTQQRTLTTGANSVTLCGIDETSRATGSRYGGVRVYTKAELEAYDPSKVKFANIELKVNKLTGLLYLSDEIIEDAPLLEQEVSQLFPMEFNFRIQDLLLRGSGAGEPLGIMNAPCLVTVAKESGQTAATVVAENIDKMRARVSGTGAEFYANKDIIPQLQTLYRHIDTAKVTPMYEELDMSKGRLAGVPIYFIEHCETLGTLGDLILADWSQYVTITKGGMKKAESMHLKFDYGQKAIRWTIRMDGQPRWRSAVTPYKGTATQSPFVALATRA